MDGQSDREDELLVWVTQKCQSGDNIELEEGWDKIKGHGTDVLESILKGENTGKQQAIWTEGHRDPRSRRVSPNQGQCFACPYLENGLELGLLDQR